MAEVHRHHLWVAEVHLYRRAVFVARLYHQAYIKGKEIKVEGFTNMFLDNITERTANDRWRVLQ